MRIQGALYIVAGMVNLLFGWWISALILSVGAGTAATLCTGILTLGMCPIGVVCYYCGLFSFALVPFGLIEIILGILVIAVPENLKGGIRLMPALFFPSILLGDIVSPIAGLIAIILGMTGEVNEWMEFEEE